MRLYTGAEKSIQYNTENYKQMQCVIIEDDDKGGKANDSLEGDVCFCHHNVGRQDRHLECITTTGACTPNALNGGS